MKYLFILAISLVGFSSKAQNFNFENWTTSIVNPDSLHGWSSTNHAVNNITTLITTLMQSSDNNGGAFSAHIQTVPFGFAGAPIVGIMVNGKAQLGFNASITSHLSGGGVAFSLRPTELNGYYKLVGSYNGLVKVILSKYNTSSSQRDTIAEGTRSLSSGTGSFTAFNVPLSYSSSNYPDTATIIIYASDPSVVPALNASFSSLYLDDFSYTVPPNIKDAGVSKLTSPDSSAVINDSVPVYGWLKNYGNVDLYNFDVAYTVNGQNKVSKTFTDTLYVNDSILFSFKEPYWKPTSAGNYKFCMFTENLVGDINLFNDTSCVNISSSLVEFENPIPIITIYPNPTRSILNLGNLPLNKTVVRIDNMSGQAIFNEYIIGNQVNLSDLPSGVYFLSVADDKGHLLVHQKIVKI